MRSLKREKNIQTCSGPSSLLDKTHDEQGTKTEIHACTFFSHPYLTGVVITCTDVAYNLLKPRGKLFLFINIFLSCNNP